MIVLTVDDSDVNLAVYRGVLGRIPDVEVVARTSPFAALDWAQNHAPDVVVVDPSAAEGEPGVLASR